ncbi:unnamed protein product [Cylicocyclus nassatus]|uniref:Uncharacterized protein n=1 Tax=Cylicocyclus nassatus TaxID=53992 RepID=A0AA36H9P9_CYLNA|nr:unnamed protein product [Cylicocyclus nassatus]
MDRNARLERSRSSDKERRIIRNLEHKLKRQDEELFVLKAKMANTSMERRVETGEKGCQASPTMEEAGTQTNGRSSDKTEEDSEPPNLFDDSEMEVNELVVMDEAGSDSEEAPLDDNGYFRKLVQETRGRTDAERKADEEQVQRREMECHKNSAPQRKQLTRQVHTCQAITCQLIITPTLTC